MQILFVTAELTPLAGTGGLGEVANSLGTALKRAGHDVRLAMPAYRQVPAGARGEVIAPCEARLGSKRAQGTLRLSKTPDGDIPLYLVEQPDYFDREEMYGTPEQEYSDNAERFCFFCQALLDGIARTEWRPDVLHCHDWHAAPAVVYLKTHFQNDPVWDNCPSLFTVHNLAFQGHYDLSVYANTGFPPELLNPDVFEHHGGMNLMKGALRFADKISTVSPRYAREIQTPEYGAGLDGELRARRKDLHGILNGIDYDAWNPAEDPHLVANYSPKKMAGKAKCKAALQDLFELPKKPNVPLLGMVSRLTWQKGVDLLVQALPDLARHDLQVVVLGRGEERLEEELMALARTFPQKIGVQLAYDISRSHQLQAGSDFFLMPSRYEPCGLSQMYSFAYGAVPVVRQTGGLADTVVDAKPVNLRKEIANGISFVPSTPQGLTRAVARALEVYQDKKLLQALQQRGMALDFSWDRSSREYKALFKEAMAAV